MSQSTYKLPVPYRPPAHLRDRGLLIGALRALVNLTESGLLCSESDGSVTAATQGVPARHVLPLLAAMTDVSVAERAGVDDGGMYQDFTGWLVGIRIKVTVHARDGVEVPS